MFILRRKERGFFIITKFFTMGRDGWFGLIMSSDHPGFFNFFLLIIDLQMQ